MINLNYIKFPSMKKFVLFLASFTFAFSAFAQLATPVLDGLQDNSTPNSVRFNLIDTNPVGTSFEVEYTGPNAITTLPVAFKVNGLVVTIPNLMPKSTYAIRTRTLNGAIRSMWSNLIYLRTLKDVPTAATVEVINNCPKFTGLQWTPMARAEDISSYIIQRSTGGDYYTVAEVPGSQRQYYDNDVAPGIAARYRIKSITESGFYDSYSPFFTTLPYSNPPAPFNLTSDASKKSDKQVNIRWVNGNFDGACNSNVPKDIYVMLRREGETEYKVYNILPQGSNNITITGLNQKEIISVQLFTLSPQTLYSGRVTIADTTYGKPFAPGPITVVAFKDAVNNSSLGLSWIDNSNDEDYFDVEFSTDSVNFKPLGTVKANINTFKHQPIEEGVKYFYRVRAGNYIFGASKYSAITFGVQYAITDKPNAPNGLVAKQDALKVVLKWRDASNNEIGFSIERSIDNLTSFTELKKVDKNVITYTDADVVVGKTYNYRVKTLNTIGVSDASNVASVILKATTGFLNENLLNIYPNPSHDLISLNLSQIETSKPLEIKVFDQSNNLMYTKTVNQKDLNIDIKKYSEGLYTVLISNDEVQLSKKFFKR